MAQFEFNTENISKVDIDKVVPNGYNPKDEDTKEYQKIKQSIKTKGLLGYILVRNHPHTPGYFEIIDGHQRYTAAKELGFKQVPIYNAGDVSDQEGKELTIWFQQQVPFSKVTEAYLVTEMVTEYGLEALEVPYSEQEISDLATMADFNFDQYKDDEQKDSVNQDGLHTFSVKLSQTDYEIVVGSLGQYAKEHDSDIANALIMLCTELRIDQGGDE